MAKNDFKAFATGKNANVMSQEEWEALPALLSGFTAGKASSAQVNKVIRQASFIAAALAQFVSDKTQRDVLDNGDLPGFVELLGSGFAVEYLSRKNPFGDIKSDGTVKTALENLGLGEARFSGRLLNTNIFKSSGKYIPTPGTKKIRVIASGGGGGGGGVPETTANQQATAGAGLSGAFIEAFFEVDNDFEVNVIIGAAGKGGGAGRNSGSEGGTTYFGSLITAPGGTGGGAGGASANTSYIQGISWGASPTSSGTVLRAFRCSAKTPGAMVISVKAVAGGTGGDTPLGSGGIGGASSSSFSGRGGGKAEGFGAGGGGACAPAGSEAQSGGDGAPGIVIVEEYA
ncbi:phage tail protein [Escherichia coli]|nr:phage tail protein [Escherichia coli]EFM0105628.1 phage tail protein [Escherichia coli]EFN4696066.1 phage tail protein [Escherichia coli]EGJ5985637.1 phage tail protein [Escherichia coli]EGY1255243.1 phage tail protein [Escherichia coli]